MLHDINHRQALRLGLGAIAALALNPLRLAQAAEAGADVRIIGLSYSNTSQVIVANLDRIKTLADFSGDGVLGGGEQYRRFYICHAAGRIGQALYRRRENQLYRDGQLRRSYAGAAGG